jgi:hypothetical protein
MSNFNKTWAFLKDFRKNTQIPNFIKICTVGAEWSQGDGRKDGQRDMTELIVAFRNFSNAASKLVCFSLHYFVTSKTRNTQTQN